MGNSQGRTSLNKQKEPFGHHIWKVWRTEISFIHDKRMCWVLSLLWFTFILLFSQLHLIPCCIFPAVLPFLKHVLLIPTTGSLHMLIFLAHSITISVIPARTFHPILPRTFTFYFNPRLIKSYSEIYSFLSVKIRYFYHLVFLF